MNTSSLYEKLDDIFIESQDYEKSDDGKYVTVKPNKYKLITKLEAFISSERQRVLDEERAWWIENIRFANGEGEHAKNKLVDRIVDERKALTEQERNS